MSPIGRVRLCVGALVCVGMPAGSWVQGSGMLAWTMYSRAGEFRIDLVAYDARGRAHSRNPAVLAGDATSAAASLLAGSDHWRQGASVAPFRSHIDDLAAYACRELNAVSVEVTLHERSGHGPERATTARRTCAQ